MTEDPESTSELTGKVQEFRDEINFMSDSRDFKDAEAVPSGQSFHLPSELLLFPLPADPGGLLSRGIKLQPDFWNTHVFLGNVASSCAYSSSSCSITFNARFNCGKDSNADKYGDTSTQRPDSHSEISAKFVSRKFIQPNGGKNFQENGADQQKTSNLGTSL